MTGPDRQTNVTQNQHKKGQKIKNLTVFTAGGLALNVTTRSRTSSPPPHPASRRFAPPGLRPGIRGFAPEGGGVTVFPINLFKKIRQNVYNEFK